MEYRDINTKSDTLTVKCLAAGFLRGWVSQLALFDYEIK